jgi:hypothetical protein
MGPGAFCERRGRTCAFCGRDDAVGRMCVVTPSPRLISSFLVRRVLSFSQNLAYLDARSRKYAREHACLQRLALYAGQARQQRGRRNQVAPVPRAILSALLDYVQFVTDLEGQVGGRRGLEGVYAYGERDARERSPARHGTRRVRLYWGKSATGHHERSTCCCVVVTLPESFRRMLDAPDGIAESKSGVSFQNLIAVSGARSGVEQLVDGFDGA